MSIILHALQNFAIFLSQQLFYTLFEQMFSTRDLFIQKINESKTKLQKCICVVRYTYIFILFIRFSSLSFALSVPVYLCFAFSLCIRIRIRQREINGTHHKCLLFYEIVYRCFFFYWIVAFSFDCFFNFHVFVPAPMFRFVFG